MFGAQTIGCKNGLGASPWGKVRSRNGARCPTDSSHLHVARFAKTALDRALRSPAALQARAHDPKVAGSNPAPAIGQYPPTLSDPSGGSGGSVSAPVPLVSASEGVTRCGGYLGYLNPDRSGASQTLNARCYSWRSAPYGYRSHPRIESTPAPPRQRSKPGPPRRRSAPRLPLRTSLPALPLSTSGPPRPRRRSLPAPLKTRSAAEPAPM